MTIAGVYVTVSMAGETVHFRLFAGTEGAVNALPFVVLVFAHSLPLNALFSTVTPAPAVKCRCVLRKNGRMYLMLNITKLATQPALLGPLALGSFP